VVLAAWAAIEAPGWINPLFKQVVPDLATLSGLMAIASLAFSPGLLEVVQYATPPSPSWFQTLPTAPFDVWGIYVPILERTGSIPLFYIGSGTRANGDVRARLLEYDRGYHLSNNLEEALRNGYTIVSNHLLVQCPIPAAADVPRVRVTFVAMEAMFSFMFWTSVPAPKTSAVDNSTPGTDLDSSGMA
jgi:hypothetical protein